MRHRCHNINYNNICVKNNTHTTSVFSENTPSFRLSRAIHLTGSFTAVSPSSSCVDICLKYIVSGVNFHKTLREVHFSSGMMMALSKSGRVKVFYYIYFLMLEIAKSFFLIVSARNFQLLVGNEKSRIISGTAFILGRHPRNIK